MVSKKGRNSVKRDLVFFFHFRVWIWAEGILEQLTQDRVHR
jgi:hypothetical protein